MREQYEVEYGSNEDQGGGRPVYLKIPVDIISRLFYYCFLFWRLEIDETKYLAYQFHTYSAKTD